MKKLLAAALVAVSSYAGAVLAADQPMIHKVELKTGGMGYMLTCASLEQCASYGPRLCPGKTAMWSDAKGQFGAIPVTMRNNGANALMIVKCQ